MAKGIMPQDPVRADHRLIKYMLTAFFKKRVKVDPVAFGKVTLVFFQMGGSWERLFKGSIQDITLLKRCIKVAIQKGIFPKSSNGGKVESCGQAN